MFYYFALGFTKNLKSFDLTILIIILDLNQIKISKLFSDERAYQSITLKLNGYFTKYLYIKIDVRFYLKLISLKLIRDPRIPF